MRLILLAVALFLSFQSSATLIDKASHVRDTASGLDWLKLTSTYGRSYDDVIAATQKGRYLEGWRLATSIEWEHLLFGQGITPRTTSCSKGNFCGYAESYSSIGNMLRLFGSSSTQLEPDNSYAAGVIADAHYDSDYLWASYISREDSGLSFAKTFRSLTKAGVDDGYTPNADIFYVGFWMVKAAPVTAPSALSFLLIGLAGLAFTQRKTESI